MDTSNVDFSFRELPRLHMARLSASIYLLPTEAGSVSHFADEREFFSRNWQWFSEHSGENPLLGSFCVFDFFNFFVAILAHVHHCEKGKWVFDFVFVVFCLGL